MVPARDSQLGIDLHGRDYVGHLIQTFLFGGLQVPA